LRPGGRFEQLNFAQKLYALAKKINTRGKGLREKTRIKMKVLAGGNGDKDRLGDGLCDKPVAYSFSTCSKLAPDSAADS